MRRSRGLDQEGWRRLFLHYLTFIPQYGLTCLGSLQARSQCQWGHAAAGGTTSKIHTGIDLADRINDNLLLVEGYRFPAFGIPGTTSTQAV